MTGSPLERDTIAAVSTAPGRGGIAVVRMSGTNSLDLLRAVFHGTRDPGTHPRRMLYGRIRDGGETVDECLASFFRAPKTYTGEDMAEIHVHGGSAAAEAALSLVVSRGARPAEPGEFTRRAFLNGRIDLTRAEAVMEIVAADNREHLRRAESLLEGDFSLRIERLLGDILAILARIELAIDFSDQSAGETPREETAQSIGLLLYELDGMIGTHRAAARIRHGVNAVIAGRVNAGKSSLFNTLLGRKRAIIHERPGTTRDWISERIELDGIAVNLIDTAGLRETPDDIEREGILETGRIVRDADIVLYLLSPDERGIPDTFSIPDAGTVITALGKADLPRDGEIPGEILRVSSLTGEGIAECRAAISREAEKIVRSSDSASLVLVERHHRHLVRAREHLGLAHSSAREWSEEIVAFEIRSAERELSSIIGKNFDSDVLDEIFRTFCIGK